MGTASVRFNLVLRNVACEKLVPVVTDPKLETAR